MMRAQKARGSRQPSKSVSDRIDALGRKLKMAFSYFRMRESFGNKLLNCLLCLRYDHLVTQYRQVFGRLPNMANPQAFTEKVLHRKIFDRDPALAMYCDKLASRDIVAETAPEVSFAKLLWAGRDPDKIPFDKLEPPLVVKPNNRSGLILFVRNQTELDPGRIKDFCNEWLHINSHGKYMGEWGYGQVDTKIVIEQMLPGAVEGAPPADIKLFVNGGRVAAIYYSTGRYGDRVGLRGFFDRDWFRLPWDKWTRDGRVVLQGDIPAPKNLDRMIEAAERLGARTQFLRVDLFNIDGKLYCTELTPYPYSGLRSPILKDEPDTNPPSQEADRDLGASWPVPEIGFAHKLGKALGFV